MTNASSKCGNKKKELWKHTKDILKKYMNSLFKTCEALELHILYNIQEINFKQRQRFFIMSMGLTPKLVNYLAYFRRKEKTRQTNS